MIRSSRRNTILLSIAFFAIIYTAVHLILALRPAPILMKWFHIDDAFYYFKVARNVVSGNGFTFDGVGLSNGFHPLWMLINLPIFALSAINLYLPFRVLLLVCAAITFLGGLFLFDLLRKYLRVEVALLGMAIWIFYWPIQQVITLTAMEAGINAFSILFFLWTVSKVNRKHVLSMGLLGFAASLMIFSRLDNIFLALLAGVWLVIPQRPMKNLILVDMLMVFFTVFSSVILRVGAYESLAFLTYSQIVLVLALMIKLLIFYLTGLYQWPRRYTVKGLILRIFVATGLSSAVLVTITLILLSAGLLPSFPRSALLIDIGLTLAGLLASRFILRALNTSDIPVDLTLRTNAKTWLGNAVFYLAPIAFLLSIYFGWNWFTFGTPMPVSGQIKQWWGTIWTIYGAHQQNLLTVLGIVPKSAQDLSPWYLLRQLLADPILGWLNLKLMDDLREFVISNLILTTVYLGLGGWLFWRKRQYLATQFRGLAIPPLLAAALLQPFYLGAIGYAGIRHWYWISQMILSVFLFLVTVEWLMDYLETRPRIGQPGKLFPYLLMILLLAIFFIRTERYLPPVVLEDDIRSYLSYTRYLEENTPAEALIGMTGGGMEGYFIQDRTIVNLDGLINSKAYFDLMQIGEGHRYLEDIGLDYVFGSAEMLQASEPYMWFFIDRLGAVATFKGMTLFVFLPGR